MSQPTPRPRVLVADDMQFFRMMLNDLLTDQGFEVLEARDGNEAMEVVRRDYPTLTLVLLDMVMPVKDGVDVLREIRANPRTEHLPVVMVTGTEVTAEQREELRSMGATGFLSKATPSTEMVSRVKQLVDEHVHRDQAVSEGAPVNVMVDYLTEKGGFSALCYRLSTQWMDLRTIQPLAVGATATLSFELPGSGEAVQVRGRVIAVRNKGDGGDPDSPPGMRIEFVSARPDILTDIKDFIAGKPRKA